MRREVKGEKKAKQRVMKVGRIFLSGEEEKCLNFIVQMYAGRLATWTKRTDCVRVSKMENLFCLKWLTFLDASSHL